MFIVYKFAIIVTVLTILSYVLSVPFTFLFAVILVIICCDSDFQEFGYNFVANLKVKNGTKKSSTSFKTQNRSNWYSSTPNMQNSRFNKYNCTFSPISKGANGISRNISNGITSTPIPSSTPYIQNSIFSPPRMTTLRSPPRYLLSDVSSVSPPVTSIKSPKPVQKVSGPLLASTRFNVSLGTYTDSKSPGLVNRIVQYDTEAKEKHTPTHQAKYGSPGVFPIVHFFKKDIPVISPKPKKVTVRIASPDTSLYDNSRYGRNFINDRGDTINGHSREPEESDASTRSVLDALKEISRKRIHSSAEFESNQESCKRQKRNDCMNNSFEYNKQTTDELPVQETTPSSSFTQPIPDKICVVDIIAASFSSSNLLKERIEKGLKRKAELEDLEQAEHKKQIKLKNAETQTTEKIKKKPTLRIYQPLESASTTSTSSESREKDVEEEKPKEHVVQRYNMFDEKKLEIHKKNKLATLLSAITGEKPVLLPYETVETTKSDSKPVSILSPQNKPKHDKHVSFNLPPESVSDALTTSENVKPLEPPDTSSIMTTPTKNNASDNLIIAETPKNMPSMPLKLSFNANNIMDSTFNNPDTKSSSINFTPIGKSLASTQMTHVMSDSPITSQAQVTSETLKLDNSKPSLTFGPISSTAAMSCSPVESNNQQFNFGVTSTTDTKSTPTKQGGFKFDFNKTTSPQDLTQAKSITKTVTSPVLSFNTSLSNASPKPLFASAAPIPPLNNNTFVAPQHNSNPPTYNFASNNSLNKQMFPTSNNSSVIPTITSAASPPMFGANTLPGSLQRPQFSNTTGSFNATTIGLPPSNASTFGKTAPTAFGTSVTNTFGTVSAPSTSAGAFGTNSTTAFGTMSAPTFSTASAMTFVSSSGFGPTTGFNNTATAPTFGSNVFNSTTTPSLFPITTVTPAFGGALPTFGNAVTTSMPVFSTGTKPFGTPNTTSTPLFGTTTATAAFGTAVATSVPMFMTTTTTSTPVFGASTTSTPMFGNNNPKNTPGFISTSPPLFGTNTITTTGFGTNPAPTMGFGTNAAPFGSNSAASTQNFSAGATKSTLFAPNTNAVTFVNTTTSAATFGTSAPSKGFSFGSNAGAVAPSFGTNRTNGPFNFNPVSTTSAPGFTATKATPSFGSNFNAPPNQAPFGTTQSLTTPISSANIFGSSTSSFGTGPSTFGAKSDNFAANTGFNNNFGNGQPFGANTGNASFGGSNNFGNTPGNTQALGFGGGDNSAFAKPQAPSNVFGNPGSGDNTIQFGNNVPGVVNSAQPTFGSSNTANVPAPGQSTVFSFGPSNQPVSPPAGGVFSFGSNDAPKPNFNFSSGANPTPGFGATSPIFGTTQTPNYNANNPQFGTPVGTFSIGSGSSNRSRTQLKAKRRA